MELMAGCILICLALWLMLESIFVALVEQKAPPYGDVIGKSPLCPIPPTRIVRMRAPDMMVALLSPTLGNVGLQTIVRRITQTRLLFETAHLWLLSEGASVGASSQSCSTRAAILLPILPTDWGSAGLEAKYVHSSSEVRDRCRRSDPRFRGTL